MKHQFYFDIIAIRQIFDDQKIEQRRTELEREVSVRNKKKGKQRKEENKWKRNKL